MVGFWSRGRYSISWIQDNFLLLSQNSKNHGRKPVNFKYQPYHGKVVIELSVWLSWRYPDLLISSWIYGTIHNAYDYSCPEHAYLRFTKRSQHAQFRGLRVDILTTRNLCSLLVLFFKFLVCCGALLVIITFWQTQIYRRPYISVFICSRVVV